MPIPIDTAFLLAVDRQTTGANCHQMRNVVEQYAMACELGYEEIAEKAKREIYALLRKQ